jgi:hypothetical protein
MRTEHRIELTVKDLDFLLRCAAKLAIELVQEGVEPEEAREAAVRSLIHSLGLFYPHNRAAAQDVPEVFRRFIESLGDE